MEMGGKRSISYEGCIKMEQNNFWWFITNSVEPLIESMTAEEIIEYNDTVNKKNSNRAESWMREKK